MYSSPYHLSDQSKTLLNAKTFCDVSRWGGRKECCGWIHRNTAFHTVAFINVLANH